VRLEILFRRWVRQSLASRGPRRGCRRSVSFSFARLGRSLMALRLMVLLLLPACYSPNFVDGKLICADGNACPSGFSCRLPENRCWKNGAVDAGSPPRDSDASSSDAPQCQVVAPRCNPQITAPSTCDPVCQGGCGCNQKCSAMFDGTFGCVPILGERRVMDSCTVTGPGTPTQTDSCAAGNICLRPTAGFLADFCFKLCGSDDNCPGVPCVSRQITTSTKSAKVCDLPTSDCNPIENDDGAACKAIDGNRPYCFLVPSTPTAMASPTTAIPRTVCDFAEGGKTSGECVSPRDCFEMFTCPPAPLVGHGSCHRVCDLATPSCAAPMTCQPWGPKYGYCLAPP
jgi:hypothetical protein